MVDKDPFFSRGELGEALNSSFWGRSVVSRHPAEREDAYMESLQEPDVALIHGAPDEYEMDSRFFGAESDLFYLSKDYDLSGTVLVTFADEYANNQNSYLELEDELGVEVVVPETQPDLTLEDWDYVNQITSENDHVRSYTSGYTAHKARKTGEWECGDTDIETFGVPTDRDTLRNQMLHNLDTYTWQLFRSVF